MIGLPMPWRIRGVYAGRSCCVRGDASSNQRLGKAMTTNDLQRQATDGVRFELTVRFHVHTLSRQRAEPDQTGTSKTENNLAQHCPRTNAPKRSRITPVGVYTAYTAVAGALQAGVQ